MRKPCGPNADGSFPRLARELPRSCQAAAQGLLGSCIDFETKTHRFGHISGPSYRGAHAGWADLAARLCRGVGGAWARGGGWSVWPSQ